MAQSLTLEDGKAFVEKLKPRGNEVIRETLPALVTVSSELGDLRLQTLRAIKESKKKPVTVWKADDLGIDPSSFQGQGLLFCGRGLHPSEGSKSGT